MRRAGQITAAARALAGKMVRPGVTTLEIDTAVRKFIEGQGAIPSFLHFPGPPGVRDFPGAACISVNDEVIHGIPSNQVLKEGDIVSVDVGAYIGGFHGDCAATFPCGKVSDEAAKLIAVTEQSFWEGMKFARFGYRGLRHLPRRAEVRGRKRLLRGAGLCGPWRGRQPARSSGSSQLWQTWPRPPACSRDDPGRWNRW